VTDVYSSSIEHILSELERVDLLIRLAVTRARRRKQADDRFEGLYISDEEIEALTADPIGLPRWAASPGEDDEAQRVLAELADRARIQAKASLDRGTRLRLEELVQGFGLDAIDRDIVLVGLAPEIDLRYERLFAYLQDDVSRRRPSVDLALNLLCPSFEAKLVARARFVATAPLVRHRLIELFDDPSRPNPPLLGKHLRLHDRVASFLLGGDDLDAPLLSCARVVDPPINEGDPSDPAVNDVRVDRLAAEAREGTLIVHLRGPRGAGKRAFAERLSARLGLRVLTVDGERLAASTNVAPELLVRLAVREAKLQRAALFLGGLDALIAPDRWSLREALEGALAAEGASTLLPLTIVAGRAAWEPDGAAILRALRVVDVAPPTHAERVGAWERALGAVPADVAAALPAVASQFRLGAVDIHAAVEASRSRARQEGRRDVSPEDLHAACRARSGAVLGELARVIRPRARFADLVLPPVAIRDLRDLCDQVRLAGRVLDAWGFASKLGSGLGLAALFAGPSGTGKTMAAEAVASELGLDLYKIDLSTVVNKYIGETEKNLGRVFAAAESSSAILFFDEADALFGRRSEVKDAHDRYANVETSYLLQKMDEHPGISILATNLRKNVDDAFARRMAFTVTFPLPGEAERRVIWEKVWAAGVPIGDDVESGVLAARLAVSGGNIRNIALRAAYLAAAEGEAVGMRHLWGAAEREFAKMGRTWEGRLQ
jgi:hypothetical protein